MVALKIIRNKQRLRKQGLLEIQKVQRIGQYDKELAEDATPASSTGSEAQTRSSSAMHHASGAVHLLSSFDFRAHLVLVFPLLGMNLYEYIKANNHRGSSARIARRFADQLVSSLQHLRS
mmetsp:Transcript_5093/g.14429  ORF Transcript_5093/g.14429 Transcript_5093/m.14429 type:complete len:120 (-) Transcript_5093:26-385(-)